jgi:hypothetical protein
MLLVPQMAPAMLSKVGFEGEIIAGNPLYIKVDDDGTIFTSQKNKTITVFDSDGNVKFIIGGKDKKWKNIIKEPRGITLFEDKLYVVDAGLGKVSMFSKDGQYIDSFGSKGKKPRQFSSPGGIDVYKGIVYVADTGNKRIQVIGPNGVYLGSIGTTGEGESLLKKPIDVAVDFRGYIYVVDLLDEFLKVYKQDGTYIGRIKGIREPSSLTLDIDGIYVSDAETFSVKKFDYDFKAQVAFGSKGTGRAQFESIVGMDVASNGKVHVADPKRGIIQVFVPERVNGTPAHEDAPPPSSVVWNADIKVSLQSIAWDPLREILYGVNKKEKAIFAVKDGQIIRKITIDKALPVAVAVAMDGGLYVVDGKKKFIYKLKPESYKVDYHFGGSGSRESYFKNPTDIVISGAGDVFVSDKGTKRVQAFSSDGVFIGVLGKGGTDDLLQSPADMDFDNDSMLYVLDDKKKSILIFGTNGMLIKEFGNSKENKLFEKPVALTVTDNEIFVLDHAGPTVKVFDKQGLYIREFGSPGNKKTSGKGEMVKPVAILAKSNTRLMISDPESNRVQELINIYTPDKVQGINARGGTRSAMVQWDKSSEAFVASYIIYRGSSKDGALDKIGESKINSYTDKDLEPSIEYFYKVAAVASEGNQGRLSDVVKAIPAKYTSAPPGNLKVQPQEWSVDLSWDKPSGDHVAYYVIYREIEGVIKEVGKSDETAFIAGSLTPDNEYTFFVSSVSSDEVESDKKSVETKTLVATRPPIEMDVVSMQDIFSNTYKNYESDGIGKIKVTNNTMDNISRLKVSFTIRDFMDFAWETEIKNLPPRGEVEVDLKAVFNNRILEVTEDTPVQTEIKLSYYANQDLRSFSSNHTINVFEKHKMKWDTRERMAAFVTTKDAVVLEFTRSIVTQYRETSDPLLYASAFFDALGVLGMTYIIDPSTPYQETSSNVDLVDYLQYPRETLKRKSGDCDDLVILFATSLESLGIRTKILDIPGHMFMMFEVGTVEALGADTHSDLFVVYEDSVWVPVEATLVGKTFLEAWEEGSRKFYKWQPQGLVGVMDLRESWVLFKPASLPASDWRPSEITREAIEKKFNKEFTKLRQIRVKLRSKRYIKILEQDPENVNAYLQLGIVFAESGELKESRKSLDKAIEFDANNASATNNLGNLYFLEGMYGKARKSYEDAIKIEPNDPYVWVNLTRSFLRLDMKKEAKEAFASAYRLDPVVAKKFRGMSLELLGPV